MSAAAAERTVVLTMRALAVAFAVTGVLFLATPGGVVEAIDDVGDGIGGFADGPASGQKLWVSLSFAYMTVIAGLALVISTDVARYRPLLLVLAAGKAASSLPAGAFFAFHDDVFVYLATFVVDGSLVCVSLACWALAGRVGTAARAP
jgi:hypothetical protein